MSLDPIVLVSWETARVRGHAEPLPDTISQRIISLRFTDKARGADKLSLTIDNFDLSLFDEPRLASGNRLHVRWGYANELTPTHVVTIKSVKGWRKLTIEGEPSGQIRAIGNQKTRGWENSTEWEVAEAIAREMGYNASTSRVIEQPTSAERRNISQAGETDFAFLIRLADRVDNVFLIRGGRFHFHPPRTDSPPQTVVTYWSDEEGIFAGEPSITDGTLGLPGRVTRRGYSTRDRRTTTGEAGNEDDTDRPVLGEESALCDPGSGSGATIQELSAMSFDQRNEYVYRWMQGRENQSVFDELPQDEVSATTDGSDSVARSRARSRFRRAERKAIKMNWPLIGDPRLTADMVIRLEGVGEKLSGNYYVEEVSHNVGPGYKCVAKVKRNARSRSSAGAQSGRAAVREAVQRIRNMITEDGRRYAAGQIDRRTYDIRWIMWTRQIREIEAGRGTGSRAARGRPNTGGARDSDELEQSIDTDPDTGGRRVTYSRRDAQADYVYDWARGEDHMSIFR